MNTIIFFFLCIKLASCSIPQDEYMIIQGDKFVHQDLTEFIAYSSLKKSVIEYLVIFQEYVNEGQKLNQPLETQIDNVIHHLKQIYSVFD